MASLLTVKNLSKSFGGLLALKEISLTVAPKQIVGIIGPNGAGKTTFFNCLSCLYHPSHGEIDFDGVSLATPILKGIKSRVRILALIFLILGVIRLPLFWSFFLPEAFFKVELFLLGVLVLAVRLFLFRGLMRHEIWAWGLMFIFLLSDLFFAFLFLTHRDPQIYLILTHVPLYYAAVPWGIAAGLFSLYFMGVLCTGKVRRLYGFRISPDAVCQMGMARTFQNIRLFFNLSVLDNVKIGRHSRMLSGLWKTLFKTRFQKNEEASAEKEGLRFLRFVGLEDKAFDLADTLAYGEQRRLEIARALASEPKVLLLDEPAAGMNARESERLMQLVRKIQEDGIAVLIIEHDMKVMMNLADYIYVFDYGRLIAQGTPDAVRKNRKVIDAYLGGGKGVC
ncbi:ABC transporter, ATP-binding protein [delta proteobacterium NaphS2]|nr:ABC transporter, ATP-binding protein [delta proteobacterium NaphS2]